MWKMPYTKYLDLPGVKESIQQFKYIKKTDRSSTAIHGQQVEESISRILKDTGMDIKTTSPQMDIGFGADLLVSYMEDDKNYSFYVDITCTQKPLVQYLSVTGATTNVHKEAFCYATEYGKFYFGLKEKHKNWFFYEKPIVVIYVENFIPCTGLALSHITNIKNILMSLNALLVRRGYGARASRIVRPNPSKFRLR